MSVTNAISGIIIVNIILLKKYIFFLIDKNNIKLKVGCMQTQI